MGVDAPRIRDATCGVLTRKVGEVGCFQALDLGVRVGCSPLPP